MLSLVMKAGPESAAGEQTFPLPLGIVTLGRTEDNEIFCIHKSLSRRHAQLECDGTVVLVTDLASKNGIFFEGVRVERCELVVGDAFRCGDVTFELVRAVDRTRRIPNAQTLPSPLAAGGKGDGHRRDGATLDDDVTRTKTKLFALVRATEVVASTAPLVRVLDELANLTREVLRADRVVVLTRAERGAELAVRAMMPTAMAPDRLPYSPAVASWVLEHGSASFADLRVDALAHARTDHDADDTSDDQAIRSVVCVPIEGGRGRVGVVYADSLSQVGLFRPDDVAFARAMSNLTAIALR